MEHDIEQDPLARAVLRHLAKARGEEDPVGAFARTVLSGEASLRRAADSGWYSEGLAVAVETSLGELRSMPPEQRLEFEREADRYRDQVRMKRLAEGADLR